MKKTILALALAVAAGLTSFAGNAKAQTTTQTFGSGENTFTLDFQTIGNAGNAADTTGYGAVNYNYSIGTYDISVNQLNAAASNGVLGLGNGYWSGDQPAANVSWYQAAAFVNFLDTNSGYQAAYNLTYSGGSYTMALWQSGQSGYDPSNPYRNSLALFVLPSENEWYKAAYYDPNANGGAGGYNLYPTGNSTPTAVASGTDANTAVYNQEYYIHPSSVYQAGGLSPYGTMGQGGNVDQWEESAYSGANTDPAEDRGIRGGNWVGNSGSLQSSGRDYTAPDNQEDVIGFRVAELSAVPEPSSYALFGLGALVMVFGRRKSWRILSFHIEKVNINSHATFFILMLTGCFMSLNTGLAATLYVSDSGDNTVEEYDGTTGDAINSSFISGLAGPLGLALSGNDLYVANYYGGTIGEYDATTGTAINSNLITGLSSPTGLVVSGNDLYVADDSNGIVGLYNATTGAAMNTNFITGVLNPQDLAISGDNLYVVRSSDSETSNDETVGLYNAATGATNKIDFITGLNNLGPTGIALSGNNLFLANHDGNTIAEYNATTGTTNNANFITLNGPEYLAVSGNNLYVSNDSNNEVGLYNATTGDAINASFVSGLNFPTGLAIGAVPEPSTYALFGLGALMMVIAASRRIS